MPLTILRNIPQPDGVIVTSRCKCVSIGTERDAFDPTSMPRKRPLVRPRSASQRRMVLSPLPDAIVWSSGLNATLRPDLDMPRERLLVRSRCRIPEADSLMLLKDASASEGAAIGTERHAFDPRRMPRERTLVLPDAASHRRMVLSQLPLASVSPSGLNATLRTVAVCPVRSACAPPCRIPETDGLIPTPRRERPAIGTECNALTLSVCPVSVRLCVPDAVSQRRMVLSPLPDARVRPSGLNAMLLTLSVCPVSVCLCVPDAASQRRMVVSSLPLASVRPSRTERDAFNESVCPLIAISCWDFALSYSSRSTSPP